LGKFYIRHGEPKGAGIDLTDTTTGVGLFVWDGDTYVSIRLTPVEANRLADELQDVALQVIEANE
jgi:hypothetical protein